EYESEGIDWKRAEFEKVVWFATPDKKKPMAGMADKAMVVYGFPLFEDRTMNKNEEKAHKSIRAAKPDTNGSKVTDKAMVVCGFPLFEDRTMNKNEEKAHKSIRAAKPDTNGSKVLICVDGDEEEDGYDDLDNEFDLGNHDDISHASIVLPYLDRARRVHPMQPFDTASSVSWIKVVSVVGASRLRNKGLRLGKGVRKYLRNPVVVIIRTARNATDLTHHLIIVKESEKMPWLQKLLDDLGDKTTIVFINTKKIADFIYKTLEKSGYRVTSLHGRDIDIRDVAHVMDYDMPRSIILIMLSQNHCSLPPELVRHEASKMKPGSISYRPPRRNNIFKKVGIYIYEVGRDKAKDAAKKNGSRASRSSSMNGEALARLIIIEMANKEKEERLAFLEIKRRETECHEREMRSEEYRQRQEDIRFHLQSYDHLIGDARIAM
ncbi:DEAD-box ATP-dependent RNA helicase 21, partial [Tanacetum coccineum]